MSIITHGGEMSLAPTVRSVIAKTGQSLRQVLHRLANYQFDAIQLDATLSGLRPRDLDHRARQDVLALLNRSNLRLSGMDLFIPRDHYLATEHLDRAMQATLASIELAADFGRIPLSIALPIQQMADDTKTALIESAEGHSVRLAVHAEDQLDELIAWVEQVDLPTVGCGLDPAAILSKAADPAALVHRIGRRLSVARLSDASSRDAIRCPIGQGDLDVSTYRIAVDLAAHRTGPVVLDLRGHEDPLNTALDSRLAWDDAGFEV